MKRILIWTLFGCLLFSMSSKAQEPAPLTLFQIEKVLRSKEVSLKERNRLLTEGVKERGITFPSSYEAIEKLAGLGASDDLIDAIDKKAPPFPNYLQYKMDREGSPLSRSNKFDMTFLLVPKGEFMMGAKETEAGSMANEKPQHMVTIPKQFYLSRWEVTQDDWTIIMGKNPSQNQQCGKYCPVDSVSWDEVQEFIKKLNEKDTFSGLNYRLPTEAEWEYAARAMTTTRYYWGDDDDEKEWRLYANADDRSPTRVGSYMPNPFGLYDMSGNVWELVADVWNTNYGKGKNDGSANLEGDANERVMKGGSFIQFLDELRSGRRGKISTNTKMPNVGFRLVAVVKEK